MKPKQRKITMLEQHGWEIIEDYISNSGRIVLFINKKTMNKIIFRVAQKTFMPLNNHEISYRDLLMIMDSMQDFNMHNKE